MLYSYYIYREYYNPDGSPVMSCGRPMRELVAALTSSEEPVARMLLGELRSKDIRHKYNVVEVDEDEDDDTPGAATPRAVK